MCIFLLLKSPRQVAERLILLELQASENFNLDQHLNHLQERSYVSHLYREQVTDHLGVVGASGDKLKVGRAESHTANQEASLAIGALCFPAGNKTNLVPTSRYATERPDYTPACNAKVAVTHLDALLRALPSML